MKMGIKARRKERLCWDEMLLETAAAIHDTSAREHHQEQTQTETEGAASTIYDRKLRYGHAEQGRNTVRKNISITPNAL